MEQQNPMSETENEEFCTFQSFIRSISKNAWMTVTLSKLGIIILL